MLSKRRSLQRTIGMLLFGLFSISVCPAQGVNIGTPPVWNFSRKTYAAGTQNWEAAQDAEGRMYFANNDGLLRFDGAQWKTFQVRNHTIVRSVVIGSEGRIYTGAQSELGYFFPGTNGQLTYTSLVEMLPDDRRTFEDVWDIHFHEGHVFFRTNREVYEYTGTAVIIHDIPSDLVSMCISPMGLLIQESGFDLQVFRDKKFVPFRHIAGLESAVTGALKWKSDTLLLSTLKHGLFYLTRTDAGRWTTAEDELLMEKRIYTSTVLPNGYLALGTSLDGLIVIDHDRRVYRHLNKKHGLQNNNILHTFCDADGNVWLGLDNGIDCVVLDSRFTTIFPDGELQATGYSAAVFNNQLYLGVSNGAYKAPWQPYYNPLAGPVFKPIDNGEGQVWGFTSMPDELMMGHHEGAFIIEDDQAKRISTEQGTWTYIPLNVQYMMAGTYTGLVLYQKINGQWVLDKKINGVSESCRIMIKDEDGSIWISHPYRGLYHINWSADHPYDPEVQFFDQRHGLPTNLNNYVFNIAGKSVFGTEKGVYAYDPKQKRFTPDTEFNLRIGADHRVRYMKEDQKGNIWYVTDREVGLLVVDEYGLKKEVTKTIFPELEGKLVGGFECIYPLDENNVIFGAEEGFIHYHAEPSVPPDTTLHIVFNGIWVNRQIDSLLFGGYFQPAIQTGRDEPQMLNANLNNLSFSYASTAYKTPYLVQYRTRLEGMEAEWSSWSPDTRRDFTNLGPGYYTFQAQARIKDGMISDTISYSFRIRPPWYKTPMALFMYGVGVLGFFAGFMMRQRRKFESEKQQMTVSHKEIEAQHIREVEQSKAALNEIQNEKLEVEIKYKNQELALTTMHLVQKAEILLSVQEGLNQLQDITTQPAAKKEIQQLLNLLNFDHKLDEDWEHFAHHFDQVHVDFLKHLREQFPQLTANDLKLCAYLRMNLSTKEIAPLMNISVRGVEGSRYRLRRKLNLPNDANLTAFILGLPSLHN